MWLGVLLGRLLVLCFFFVGFESEASWVKKITQPSSVLDRLTNKKGAHQNKLGAFFHQLTAEEREKPLLPAVANSHSKGGARPPSNLLNYTQKQGAHNDMKECLIPKKAHNAQKPRIPNQKGLSRNRCGHTIQAQRKNSRRDRKDTRRQKSRLLPFSFMSLTTSLSFFVTARPR